MRQRLIAQGRTRWLDLGSQNFSDGFHCMDIGALPETKSEFADRYFQLSALNLSDDDVRSLGTFDVIRMQHVLEHFSFEEAQPVLRTCARLLKPGGYLLISVPDLRLHLKAYLSKYRSISGRIYRHFAVMWRVPEDAPPSCVFSVFAHQSGYRDPPLPGDAHKWCYDFDGVRYQIEKAGGFDSIRQLSVFHPLAGTPFTHNRPAEDLCVLATRT